MHTDYDLHPSRRAVGYENEAWGDIRGAARELASKAVGILRDLKKCVIFFDCYPGVIEDDITSFASETVDAIRKIADEKIPVTLLYTRDCAKSEDELNALLADYLTDDRVFGVMCPLDISILYDPDKLGEMSAECGGDGVTVVIGTACALLGEADIHVWCGITRWEIQLRYRRGMPNLYSSDSGEQILKKYKRGYFVEWRLADRYKEKLYDTFDYVLETERAGEYHMVTGNAYRAGLRLLASEPFRLEPYFDPGVWGGKWMQEHFGLDKNEKNFAWSFDGVPEENAVNLDYGTVKIKLPALDVVKYCPRELLGEAVYARFGAEFPIRFDFLDTVHGGNLSLQVHPQTEYIKNTFAMPYTQDESYYILDTDENAETYVYLGVKNGISPEEMHSALTEAEHGIKPFDAEKFVNKIPVKKHDHVLIPAGTVHCSGKNTVVLEISATPYIFTFKLWDWGRVGLDGLPRPTHIEHGMKNIDFTRDTDFVMNELIHRERTVSREDGLAVERTGLYDTEFIETYRYSAQKRFVVETRGSVAVLNLVEGKSAMLVPLDENGKERSDAALKLHYAETVIIPNAVQRLMIVPGDEEIKIILAKVRI